MADPTRMETETSNAGWLASLKALLFGYDFFISYSQDEAARAYGAKLQSLLAARDFVVFRDVTELHAGDALTLRIRWCLWRTRCLVVLATERAITSEWVQKEINIFAQRKRRIIPLDLQNVRARNPWREIEDALFESDSLPEPSTRIADKLAASLRGWRANKRARLTLAGTAVATLTTASILTWQAISLRERALRLRTHSLVAIAQSHPDPLVRSLVLLEADATRLPPDGLRTAREVARAPVPEAVLRVSGESFSAMAISLDDHWVLTADDSSQVRRWQIDGKTDPALLCKLEWRPGRMDALGSMVFCAGDSQAALVPIDTPGEPKLFTKPAEEEAKEGDQDPPEEEKPETPRWTVADRTTAWRASGDGRVVAFCADELRVVVSVRGEGTGWKERILPLPGRAALDIQLSPQQADGSFAGSFVCTDGSHAAFTCDKEGKFHLEWRLMPLVPKGEHVRFPEGVADACAIHAAGSSIVCGLGSTDGLVVAAQAANWVPRIYRPREGRKLKRWLLARDGHHALLQWEDGEASYLRLEDFHEVSQPISTRIRVLTQSDYAMGMEGQPSEPAKSEAPEMPNPALSPDGALVVLPTLRNAWVWSIAAGHPVATLRAGLFFDEGVRPVFSPSGKRFVTADRAGEMRVWRVDGNQLDPRVVGLRSQTVKLGVGKSGRILAGTRDGDVFLIPPESSASPKLLHRQPGQMARCAVSPSGQRGAAIFKDGSVALFDLETGILITTVKCEKPQTEAATYENVEFTDEEHVLAFGGVTPTLIESRTGRIVASVEAAWDSVSIAGGTGAKVALVKTPEKQLRLVTLPSLQWGRTLPLPDKAEVWDITLSPTGALAAVGLGDGRILVFETASGREMVSITVDDAESSVDHVAISADGRHLAFGTYSGKVGVVELRCPRNPRWFQAPNLEQATGLASDNHGHLGVVSDLRFSPEGTRIVSCGGMDGFTRIWNLEGACIEALNTAGVATFARFLDDGRLATLTEQGEIAFWRVSAPTLLEHLRRRSNATLLPSERVRYLGEDPDTAYERYQQEERRHGRTALPREYTKIDYR